MRREVRSQEMSGGWDIRNKARKSPRGQKQSFSDESFSYVHMHKENMPLLHHKQGTASLPTVSSYLITGAWSHAICCILMWTCMYSKFSWIPQTFINTFISGGTAHLSHCQGFRTDGTRHLAGLSLIHSYRFMMCHNSRDSKLIDR